MKGSSKNFRQPTIRKKNQTVGLLPKDIALLRTHAAKKGTSVSVMIAEWIEPHLKELRDKTS